MLRSSARIQLVAFANIRTMATTARSTMMTVKTGVCSMKSPLRRVTDFSASMAASWSDPGPTRGFSVMPRSPAPFAAAPLGAMR